MTIPATQNILLLMTLFMISTALSSSPTLNITTIHNILDFGANPDGRTDSTASLSKAWSSACGSAKPSTVYIPPGKFLIRNILFSGPCRSSPITFRSDSTLVAPADYNVIGEAGNWLHFEGIDGLSIIGGTLDGQGAALWECKMSGKYCPDGATSLEISKSKNVVISGLKSMNSQLYHIVIHGSNNVTVDQITAWASGESPNTDGVHVQLSTGVAILNSKIGTGDDCVSIGPGTSHLFIQNMACGPGHGISIGSLGKSYEEAGVQDVRVEYVVFKNTQNGVRIKTWGRPSTGFVSDVVFRHAVMSNVENPIVIDQNYCPHNKNCPGQVSGVNIREVTYQDIKGTSASQLAVKFECSKGNPCNGIKMEDINLSYKNKPANASCANAAGFASGLIKPTSCLA